MSLSWSHFKLAAILLGSLLFFLFFHERYLSGHDPANFVLMLRYGFDVSANRPHAPGYPGFYLLWIFMKGVTGMNNHSVILAGNLIFTLLSISLGYWSTKKLFGVRTAVLTALLIASNPLTLFYSSVSEIYSYDAAFSAFVVILLITPPRRYIWLLYFIYGVLGGFRLSSVILTFPVIGIVLFIRGRSAHNWKTGLLYVTMIGLGTLAWLIPFSVQLGGFDKWFGVFRDAGAFAGSFAQNLGIFVPAMFWMLNVTLILILRDPKRIWMKLLSYDSEYRILSGLIIVPMLFFVFFCYSKGYALLYIVPMMILLSRMILSMKNSSVVLTGVVCCNLLVVFTVPFIPPPARSALNHEHRISSERWESSVLRGISFFAPTISHIRMSDSKMVSTLMMLHIVPENSYVVIDNAAALYAYPRSLQAAYPDLHFLMPRLDDSIHAAYYYKDSMRYDYQFSTVPQQNPFYYVTLSGLSGTIGNPMGQLVDSNQSLLLYRILPEARTFLFQRLQTYFARGLGK